MSECSSEGKGASIPEVPEILSVQGALSGIAHDHFFKTKCNGKKKKSITEKIGMYKGQTKHTGSKAEETVRRLVFLL